MIKKLKDRVFKGPQFQNQADLHWQMSCGTLGKSLDFFKPHTPPVKWASCCGEDLMKEFR